ncbi:MAG: 30S ribosome-binding factor RbfA [Candidatus Omnitrophota bacterium]|nr:MAG: 30S ribosome-binding factor RbfA [Candidatus Omnitrophota bacterium]
MSVRMDKINKEIQKQLMAIIQEDIDDPVLEFLSITRVATSSDLHEARVYYSLLDESKYDRAKESLDKMNKFIRMNLGKRIRIKILPQLKFIPDDTIRYSVDIYHKIEEITEEDKQRHNQDEESD